MALVSLGTLRDYWKRVYDWIGSGLEPKVQLTGRNVEELIPFDAVAIRDTISHTCTPYPVPVSKYKNIQMIVTSTLNQSVTIRLYPDGADIADVWDGTKFTRNDVVIPAETRGILLNTKWTFLNDGMPFRGGGVYLAAVCGIAPTEGSLTIYMEGVPN